MHAIHKRHPPVNIRVPKRHGVISLPEIGIEVIPEDPGTHGIGAVKHLIGEHKISE